LGSVEIPAVKHKYQHFMRYQHVVLVAICNSAQYDTDSFSPSLLKMADTKTVRSLVVLEAYSNWWAPWKQRWRLASHVHLAFEDDLSEYEILPRVYSCAGIVDAITSLMENSETHFKNL
jgi:hypothetical protein